MIQDSVFLVSYVRYIMYDKLTNGRTVYHIKVQLVQLISINETASCLLLNALTGIQLNTQAMQ